MKRGMRAGSRELTPETRRQLLALIRHDEVAHALIAAWPNVDRSGTAGRESVCARWAPLAGVRVLEAIARWDMLVGNGMVRMDGTVDETTDRFVGGMMLASLPPALRTKRESE